MRGMETIAVKSKKTVDSAPYVKFEYKSHEYVHDNAQVAQMKQPLPMVLKIESSKQKADVSLFSCMDWQ